MQRKLLSSHRKIRVNKSKAIILCVICQSTVNIEKHRIFPGRLGGKYENDNIAYLCRKHHYKADRFIREREELLNRHGVHLYPKDYILIYTDYIATILKLRAHWLTAEV